MPSPAFTLSVPADEPYRGLVAEVVRAFLRSPVNDRSDQAGAFATSVGAQVDRLAAAGRDIAATVHVGDGQVEVRLSSGDATETLIHAVTAAGG